MGTFPAADGLGISAMGQYIMFSYIGDLIKAYNENRFVETHQPFNEAIKRILIYLEETGNYDFDQWRGGVSEEDFWGFIRWLEEHARTS